MKLLRRINERKGFTFVEMMMVIAILAVILAFAVPGFASYSKRIKLMELDDSARTIFMAAQNRLMSLHTSGADIDFAGSQSVKIDEVPDCFTKVKDEHGNEKEYYDYTAEGYYQPDFRYITSKKIKDIADSDHSIIVELSSGGPTSIEDQLYQNYFIIEYDASTGFVFGVFYSETDGGLDGYNTETSPRDFEERLKDGGTVGYYGGGTLVNIPRGAEVAQPVANKGNLEKLVFTVEYPATGTEDKYYFSFTIWEADESFKRKPSTEVIIVPKADVISDSYYVTKGGAATIILDSLAPGMGSDKGKWNPPTDTKDMTGYVLERDFKGWVYRDPSGNPVSDNTMWANNSYPNEMGRYYLINPGANIIVEIDFYDPTGIKDEYTLIYGDNSGNQVNSYFERLDGSRASITAGRHLQNLANYVDGNLVMSAELNATIDFSLDKTGTADCYSAWNSAETYKGNGSYDGDENMKTRAKNLYDFKPVGSQFVDASTFLKSFDGHSDKGYMIKYLRINTDPDVHPEYKNSGADLYNYTGFFVNLKNSGDVKNICFYCPVVIGKGEYTGLFYGFNDGGSNFPGMTVINPIVEGPGYVGGFVGVQTGGGTLLNWEIYVKEVDDYFDNYDYSYANNNVDGIAATASYKWGDPTKDPYQRFVIRGTSDYKTGKNGIEEVKRRNTDIPLIGGYDASNPDSGPFVGGLVGYTGYNHDKLQFCYAAIRVESVGYAGGLVGYMPDGGFNTCYVGGHTYDGSYICDDIGNFPLINVYGFKGAGGLVGYCTSYPELGSTGIYTTCSVGSAESNIQNTDTIFGSVPDVNNRDYGEKTGRRTYSAGRIMSADYDEASKTYSNAKIVGLKSKSSNILSSADSDIQKAYDEQVVAEPYDTTLEKKYPYANDLSGHIGDWPVDPPVMGVFYWEKIKKGSVDEYGILGKFYDAKKGESDKIDTLTTEDAEVTEYGYGYFYTPAVTSASKDLLNSIINNTDYAVDKSVRDEIEKDTQVMPIIIMRNASSAAVHDLVSLSFDYSYKGTSGEKTFRFNPDFCGVSADDDAHTIGEEENRYRIRSAVQFSNIKNSLGAAFEQDLSINLVNHYAIGSLKKGAFTGMYNGKGKTIEVHNLFFEAGSDIADGNGIGIFGVTRGAKIEKIEANYSSSNIYDISGESSSRIGVGGIAGIAIGGSIENCKVYNFNVSVTNRYNTAIGGIVGYSSADISNCELCGGKKPGDADNSAISIDNQTGGSAGDVAAAGGIAGSASGTITKCKVNPCSMGDMKSAKIEAEGNAPLVIAGGIVGNNVSFEGKTELTVDSCISHAQLTRPSGTIAENGNTVYDRNVLIHPIAPDIFTIDLNNLELYLGYESNPEADEETKKNYIMETLVSHNIVKQNVESIPIYHVATGTGVNDVNAVNKFDSEDYNVELTVTINNCSAYQGAKHYNSRVCGDSANSSDKVIIHPEEGDIPPTRNPFDVYVFVPPKERSYVKYVKLAPTAGIYSLYEKDGSSIFAKAYFKDEPIDDKPDDHSDPLYRYGVLVTLGRFDEEEVVVTIDKGKPNEHTTKAIGQSYTDQNGNAITLSTSDSGNAAAKYFDFSEEIISEPGSHTVTVEYKGEDGSIETVLDTTIDIPERCPYVGVYQLREDSGTKLDGVYTDETRVGDHLNEITSNGTEIGEYGIMLEHSDVAPHTLGEIKVTLSYKVDEKVVEKVLKPSELVNAGKDAYSGENWVKPQVHGKYFDFYNISKSVLEEIPEYTEITITVRYKDGEKLASAAYRTPLQIPHFGVYGVETIRYTYIDYNPDYPRYAEYKYIKYAYKYADDKENSTLVTSNEIKFKDEYAKAEENLGVDSYGILLESGYDISKVKVTLSGGDDETTLDSTSLERCSETYKNSADENRNDFNPSGVSYSLYTIKHEDIPENTTTITLEYEGKMETFSIEVNFVKQLNLSAKKHKFTADKWSSDETEHWKQCSFKGCTDKQEVEPHKFGEWRITKQPTKDTEGEKAHTCEVCGKTVKESIPPHEHTFSELKYDDTGHWQECTAEDCPFGKGEKINFKAHTSENIVIEFNKDNLTQHFKRCTDGCGYNVAEEHKWTQYDETDTEYKFKCSICNGEKTEPKASPEQIKNVGAYVFARPDQWNSGYMAWYTTDGSNYDQQQYRSYSEAGLTGEAGFVINKTFINQIEVYIDGVSVDGQYDVDKEAISDISQYFENKFNTKGYTAYKFSEEALKGKEVIHVQIKNLNGGGLLFDKEIKIRNHEHIADWQQPQNGQDTSMHYGECTSAYCPLNDKYVSEKHTAEKVDDPNTLSTEMRCKVCGYEWSVPATALLFVPNPMSDTDYDIVFSNGKSIGNKSDQHKIIFLAIETSRLSDIDKITIKNSLESWGTEIKLDDYIDVGLMPDIPELEGYTIVKALNIGGYHSYNHAAYVFYNGDFAYNFP